MSATIAVSGAKFSAPQPFPSNSVSISFSNNLPSEPPRITLECFSLHRSGSGSTAEQLTRPSFSDSSILLRVGEAPDLGGSFPEIKSFEKSEKTVFFQSFQIAQSSVDGLVNKTSLVMLSAPCSCPVSLPQSVPSSPPLISYCPIPPPPPPVHPPQ